MVRFPGSRHHPRKPLPVLSAAASGRAHRAGTMSATARGPEAWERAPLRAAAAVIDDLRRRCASCPPVRTPSPAAIDFTSLEIRSDVQAHIDSCPACLALRAALEEVGPGSVGEEEAVDAAGTRASGRYPAIWLAVPAAAAAVLAVTVIGTPHRDRFPAPIVPALAKGPTASSLLTSHDRPAEPVLTKPEVKLTMLALRWRGGGQPGAGFAEAVAPALQAFRADNYEESRRLLAALASRYPSSVEIPFYQGVSELFLGLYRDSVITLQRAGRLADAAFAADAAWYLGIALSRAGEVSEARARFAALCKGENEYAARACIAAR